MRSVFLGGVLLLAACGGAKPADEEAEEIPSGSIVGAFIDGFVDELRGAPEAEELKKTKRFEQAGVSFDYPEVLRLHLDDEDWPSWELERGDFELELHQPDSAIQAADYLRLLAQGMSSGKAPVQGPEAGIKVHWCGQPITAVRWRITFFGDPHELLGFDLPPSPAGPRFLTFSDMLTDGHWSATAQAAFDALNASIRCHTVVASP